MESGCLKGLQDKCLTEKFYLGPYDKSDGLIPIKSTHLDNADYITLAKADHAEIILRVPFEKRLQQRASNNDLIENLVTEDELAIDHPLKPFRNKSQISKGPQQYSDGKND